MTDGMPWEESEPAEMLLGKKPPIGMSPDVFSGVGIIAGGPFGCAGGSLATAMTRCMSKVEKALPAAEFVEEIVVVLEKPRCRKTCRRAWRC